MTRWLIFFLVLSSTAFCQQVIHGSVVDKETGKPVPFASVGIVGTSKGTSTNLNGEFSLAVTGSVSIKITCIGYESVTVTSTDDVGVIQLMPVATQLNNVIILGKALNPRTIVRRAFSNISSNYEDQAFLQKFFYRQYCKDDATYGRLVEASVEVWKHQGYRSLRSSTGDKEDIRVTQLRRSLDKTIMAQGHEPISISSILQADLVGYQTPEPVTHLKFYEEASNIKTDFDMYIFTLDGVTTYDGQEVYKLNYRSKKDSILTTSGYIPAPSATGSLFIALGSYAIVKFEELKQDGPNTTRTSAFYRKYGDKYYPYHFIRDGEYHFRDHHQHSSHVELMSVEIQHGADKKFTGRIPGKEELLKIPYDSAFWNTQTILKTTPLEDDIIRDLGGGRSLNEQFYRYQKYEWSITEGGRNGEEKFNWFKEDCKGERILYVCFLPGNVHDYLHELEQIKRLNKLYRNKITFILLSIERDEARWQQAITRYNLFSDGIINYRIDDASETIKLYRVKETPAYIILSRDGSLFDATAKPPSDPLLEEDFKSLLQQAQKQ